MYIHRSESFPDVTKGIVIPEASRHSLKLAVSPSYIHSTPHINVFTNNVGCSDKEEGSTTDVYTRENCLLRCRLRSIQQSCNCVPYYFPIDGKCKLKITIPVTEIKHI